jgi:hypothetical protein
MFVGFVIFLRLFLFCGVLTGWRPVKPPAMPEATYSKPGLRLGHVPG